MAPAFQSPVQAAAPAPVEVSLLSPVSASPEVFTAVAQPTAKPVGPTAQPITASATSGPVAASTASPSNVHAVKSGETLWQIAKVHQVEVRVLASVNQLSPETVLKVGQVLQLPIGSVNAAPSNVNLGAASPGTVSLAKLAQSTPALSDAVMGESDAASAANPVSPAAEAVVEPIKSNLAELGEESKLSQAPSKQDGLPVTGLPVTKLANVPLPAIGGPEPQSVPQAIVSQAVDVSSDVQAAPAVVAAVEQSQPISAPADAAPPLNPTPLLAEIHNLRSRQSRQKLASATNRTLLAQAVTPTEPAISSSKPQTVAANPDFAGRKVESALSIELRNFVNPKLKSESGEAAKSNAAKSTKVEPQIVARASVGTGVDATPVTPAVQRMVRPDLPSIGRQDAYIPGSSGSQGYVWPSQGLLSSGYGWRWGRMHRGIDIAAPVGTPIVSVAAGKVVYAGWNDGGYGYMVEVEHEDGTMTRYAHNNRILVEKGQQVAQGQQISEMGSTGFSTGPHLHFEIHPRGGAPVNPMAFLGNQS